MHPIERLRYVARASGADQALLVQETAHALGAFRDDPAGLVAACRRVLDRHPGSGALWSLCARVLTAAEPDAEAWAVIDEVAQDPTVAEVAHALPDEGTVCVVGWPEVAGDALVRRGDLRVLAIDAHGEAAGLVRRLHQVDVDAEDVPASGVGAAVRMSDVVLVEAVAAGPDGLLAVAGSLAAAAVARQLDVPVWGVIGAGRALPAPMWDAVVGRQAAEPAEPWLLDEEVVPLALCTGLVQPSGAVTSEVPPLTGVAPVAFELVSGGSAPGTYRRA